MHYVMSDIHGGYEYFRRILDEIRFSDSDVLYVIGDVIDRGPHNIEMLQFCRCINNVYLIKGNHEYFMELTARHPDFAASWYRFGGRTTLGQMDLLLEEELQELFRYVEGLPWMIEVDQKEIPQLDRPLLLTHTGFLADPDRRMPGFCHPDLTGEEPFDIARAVDWWSRHEPYEYSISSDLYQLPDTVRFDKRLIVGHVPVMSGYVFEPVPYIYEQREYIDIDCGCGFRREGGRLACMRLEDGRIWYR